jgi:hypothetical protein
MPNSCTSTNQFAIATPAPTSGANSVLVAAVEEVQEAPDVVIVMFLVNDTSAVVLFESEASNCFISATYVGKHNLPLALLRCHMIVLREEVCPQGSYAQR